MPGRAVSLERHLGSNRRTPNNFGEEEQMNCLVQRTRTILVRVYCAVVLVEDVLVRPAFRYTALELLGRGVVVGVLGLGACRGRNKTARDD